ncbi:MAG: hypothetical protein ACFNNL_01950 [Kingella oralis]
MHLTRCNRSKHKEQKTWQHDAYQNARRSDWDAEIIGDQPPQID